MKYKFCLSLIASTFVAVSSFAENPTPMPGVTDAMMEAFAKASTPGEEHKLLQQYVGKWTHVVKWWMKADAKPETSNGTTEITSIMGGRFIKQDVSGTSMGQPFQGMGLVGYDNIQKHFSTIWIDNMMTGMMIGSGTLDKAKNAIVDSGSASCPMSPTGKREYRAVWSLPEKNSFKYEMYTTGEDGKEFKAMEIVYTKAS